MKKYLLLLFFAFGLKANAQVTDLRDLTNVNNLFLNECGKADTLTYFVRNCCFLGGTMTNVVLEDSLPADLIYIGYVPSLNINSVTKISDQKISISFKDIPHPQIDTFQLLVKAKCGARSNTSIVSNFDITYSVSGTTYSQSFVSNDMISGIKKPSIQLTPNNIVNIAGAKIGDTLYRKWKITNTGVASELDTFTFGLKLENGVELHDITAGGVSVLSSVTYKGDTLYFDNIKHLANFALNPNDTFEIVEVLILKTCSPTGTNSYVTAYWGCGGEEVCEANERYPNVTSTIAIPDIKVTRKMVHTNCWNGAVSADTLIITLDNKGGLGSNLQMKIDLHNYVSLPMFYSGSENYRTRQQRWYLDTGEVFYTIGNGSQQPALYDTILTSSYNLHPEFGVYNQTGRNVWAFQMRVDELPANEEIKIYIPLHVPCSGDSSSWLWSSAYMRWTKTIAYEGTYQDNCGNVNYDILKVNANGSYGEYFASTPTGQGPSDMNQGDTGIFQMEFNKLSNYWRADDSTDYFKLIVHPTDPRLVWDGNMNKVGIFRARYGQAYYPADSVYYDTANNIIEVFWKNYYNNTARRYFRFDQFQVGLVLDCSKPPGTGGTFVDMHLLRVHSTNCSPICELGISPHVRAPVQIHCPSPCPRGGTNPKGFVIERINFGQADTNDDGRPDNAPLQMNLVQKDKVYVADTLQAVYASKILRGSQSPLAPFRFGYAISTFPASGRYISPLTAKVEIYDISRNRTYTINGVTAKISNGSWPSRTYKWDFSADTLSTNFGGLPPGYFYDHNDSVTITAQWIVDKNQGITHALNAVENEFYVSHLANPHDTDQYTCNSYNGQFTNIGYFKTVSTPHTTPFIACQQKRIDIRYYESQGLNDYAGDNRMTHEYRPRAILDTVWTEVPDGVTIDSIRWYMSHGAGTAKRYVTLISNITPDRVIPGTFYTNRMVFDAYKLYTINGGTVLPSDEGYIEYMQLFIRPNSNLPKGINNIMYGGTHKKLFPDIDNYSMYRISAKKIWLDKPVLNIGNVGAITQNAGEKLVTWDVSLTNFDPDFDAANAWFSFKSRTGGIIVDSVLDIRGDTLLNKTGIFYGYGDLNANGDIANIRIYATNNICFDDTLDVYGDWDCDGIPTTNSVIQNADSTFVVLQPIFPEIQSIIIKDAKDTVDMCEEFEYIISVSNRDPGVAYRNDFEVELPNTLGISLVPDSTWLVYLKNPLDTIRPNFTQISPTKFKLDVDNLFSDIGKDGLRRFADRPENEYHLRIKITTDCGYISGSNVVFTAKGYSACDSLSPATVESRLPLIRVAAEYDNRFYFSRFKCDDILGCKTETKVDAKFYNFSIDTTLSSDFAYAVLPAGVNYITNSATFSTNTPVNTEPTISDIFGKKRLEWHIPAGIVFNDSMTWNFFVEADDTSVNCGPKEINVDILSEIRDTCIKDNTPCTVLKLHKKDDYPINIIKPDVTFDYADITVTHDSSAQWGPYSDSIKMKYRLLNSAAYNSDTVVIKLYMDVDSSGTLTAGDYYYGTDTVPTVYGLSHHSGDTTFTTPFGVAGCPVIQIVDVGCNCNGPILPSNPTCNFVALPVSLLNFNALYDNQSKVYLNWQTVQEIDLDRFEIYRASNLNNEFKYISEKKAFGNSNHIISYKEIDDVSNLKSNTLYYRLKYVDVDGAISWSDVKTVFIMKDISNFNFDFISSPNPVNNTLVLNFNKKIIKNATLKVIDISGRIVLEKQLTTNTIKTTIDMSNYNEGTYIIVINTGQKEYKKKVIKL